MLTVGKNKAINHNKNSVTQNQGAHRCVSLRTSFVAIFLLTLIMHSLCQSAGE